MRRDYLMQFRCRCLPERRSLANASAALFVPGALSVSQAQSRPSERSEKPHEVCPQGWRRQSPAIKAAQGSIFSADGALIAPSKAHPNASLLRQRRGPVDAGASGTSACPSWSSGTRVEGRSVKEEIALNRTRFPNPRARPLHCSLQSKSSQIKPDQTVENISGLGLCSNRVTSRFDLVERLAQCLFYAPYRPAMVAGGTFNAKRAKSPK